MLVLKQQNKLVIIQHDMLVLTRHNVLVMPRLSREAAHAHTKPEIG